MKAIVQIAIALLMLSGPSITDAKKHQHSDSAHAQRNKPGMFDYYLLSLSWSPDHCASHPDDGQQCASGKRLGFVLHGLWPQYLRGYPENCSTVKLPPSVKSQFAGLYPSDALFVHEWEKHGTCSGLLPADYLALSKELKDGVIIPAPYKAPSQPFRTTIGELRTAFRDANPTLPEDAIAMSCSGSGRFLQEVYVCFDKDSHARTCSDEVVKKVPKSCGQPSFLVRSVK
jgi:ribonuclease T2